MGIVVRFNPPGLTTDQYEKELERWDKLLMSITRK